MNRVLRFAIGFLAILLVPVALYVALHHLQPIRDPVLALWGPIVVLLLDAALCYVALGAWEISRWDKVGIAAVLPLLLAMASWAAMMGRVAEQMKAAG